MQKWEERRPLWIIFWKSLNALYLLLGRCNFPTDVRELVTHLESKKKIFLRAVNSVSW